MLYNSLCFSLCFISSNVTTTEQCRQRLRNSKKENPSEVAKLHIQTSSIRFSLCVMTCTKLCSHKNTRRSKSYYKPNSVTKVALTLHTYSLENLHTRLAEYSCDSRRCAGEVAVWAQMLHLHAGTSLGGMVNYGVSAGPCRKRLVLNSELLATWPILVFWNKLGKSGMELLFKYDS